MNYGLNDKGELLYLEIVLRETEEGVTGVSALDDEPYLIEGATLETFADLVDEGDDEVLEMVSELGGGLWSDDPSGTTTIYDYQLDRKVLLVTEQ